MTSIRIAVITAVTAVVLALGSPAYASYEAGMYPDYASCMAAGQEGVDRGEWISFYCKWVWGDYILWVS